MNIKLLVSAMSFSCAAVGVAVPAAAAGPDWYLGANAGVTHYDASSSDLDSALSSDGFTASSSVDDSDTGYKLFLGYQFNQNFAVEGGYVDLGKMSFSSTITAPSAGTVSGDVKTKNGLFLDAVGTLPLGNNFSVFGRLGVYSIKTELTASGSAGSVSSSDTGSDFHWGIGAGYDFTPNLGARLEWERFNKVGNKDKTGEGDVDLASVGLVYRF